MALIERLTRAGVNFRQESYGDLSTDVDDGVLALYVRTGCRVVNGEIEERNVGEYDHNAVQKAILLWFHQHDEEWHTRSIQEQRTRLRSGNVRLPDVSVFPRDLPIEQVYTRPQLIAIEVLSPEDRQSRAQERIADYIDFGVANIWFIDPKKRMGWDCASGDWIRKDRFEVEASPIYLSLDEMFRLVDTNEE